MAFTTLMLFQLFNVFNARSDEQSAFRMLVQHLHNWWLWGAIALSLALHLLVIYLPFLQQAFSTVGLSLGDWLVSIGVASTVLWLRELSKVLTRRRGSAKLPADPAVA